jgi:integrase
MPNTDITWSTYERTWATRKTGRKRTAWVLELHWTRPDGSQGHSKKHAARTKREADELALAEVARLKAETLSPEGAVPAFHDFALKFLKVAKPTLKKQSWDLYRLHLEKFLVPEFGRRRVDQIGLEHIELFRARLLSTPRARKLPKTKDGRPPKALAPKLLSPKYVNSIVDTLLRVLHKAHEYRLVPYVPKLKKARVPRRHPRFFDFTEADAVLEAAKSWEEEPLVPFLMRTGLRIGEALELKWTDVDWTGKRLFVARGVYAGEVGDTKSSRDRFVPLPGSAVAALKRQETCGLSGPYVFPRADGTQHDRQDLTNGFHGVARRAGVPPFGPHTLRHTYASHLVMRGTPLLVVRDLLGHSDVRMTERYSHLAPAIPEAHVAKLDEPAPVANPHRASIAHAGSFSGVPGVCAS